MKLISFVFSFRNEEKNLKNLVERVDKAVKKTENWNYELIFVNDDSTDNSEKILLDLQKELPIKIINMSRRFGTNPCVLAGFENCSGDCIIYMDSDLQDPPELIPSFIELWEKGNDIVYGVRAKREEGFFLRTSRRLYYKLLKKVTYVDYPENVGDFQLVDKKVIEAMKLTEDANPELRKLGSLGSCEYIDNKKSIVNTM